MDILRVTKAPAHDVVAVWIELGDEDVRRLRFVLQRRSTEIQLAAELTGDDDIACGVCGHSSGFLAEGIPETFAPDVLAGRVKLGEKEVGSARDERSATKIDGDREGGIEERVSERIEGGEDLVVLQIEGA